VGGLKRPVELFYHQRRDKHTEEEVVEEDFDLQVLAGDGDLKGATSIRKEDSTRAWKEYRPAKDSSGRKTRSQRTTTKETSKKPRKMGAMF